LLTYKTAVPILLGLSSFLTTYYIVRQCVMVFFERQENPVGKIIDYTKKSFEGAIKSFQDILNAENNSKGEGVMVKFFQSLGVFEFSVLSLGAGSLFVFFSRSPWHFQEVWFLKTFAASPPEFEWLPFGVGGLTLLALAMAYNTTTGEVRRFYIKEPTSKFNKTLYRIGNAHFYIDKFYTQFFTRLMVGRPTANMQLIFSNEPDVHYQFTKGLSRKFKRIEEKGIDFFLNKIIFSFLFLSKIVRKVEQLCVDGVVVWLSTGIKKWGNSLRKLQAGQLQGYILGMVLVVITVLIIKSFIA
jgi:NADH:ubiquinone oxidoreductase subunit 5 (subunit L)/multisubunit Na+/H+ antiporter MnhA subunit